MVQNRCENRIPGMGYPRLGARGSGLGAGAGLILDYRKIVNLYENPGLIFGPMSAQNFGRIRPKF